MVVNSDDNSNTTTADHCTISEVPITKDDEVLLFKVITSLCLL